MSTVLETEEQQALRAAVAALGKRYGRDYMTSVVRDGAHPASCGPKPPSSATWGSTSPRSSAAEAAE